MRVRNINGTGPHTCNCKSWLEHWRKYGGPSWRTICCVTGCNKTATQGAHVQKAGSSDEKWYIIPVCDEHNAKSTELTIDNDYQLAPANVAETCGK
jgi:hypothetical protein